MVIQALSKQNIVMVSPLVMMVLLLWRLVVVMLGLVARTMKSKQSSVNLTAIDKEMADIQLGGQV